MLYEPITDSNFKFERLRLCSNNNEPSHHTQAFLRKAQTSNEVNRAESPY